MHSDPLMLPFEYMRHTVAAVSALDLEGRPLFLHSGAGVCSLPRALVHLWPQSRHIAVDIDADLPRLAREWWDLPRAPRLRIRSQDGLAALEEREADSVDVIIRDAFGGSEVPGHLSDANWWTHAHRVARVGVIANIGVWPGRATGVADARHARDLFQAAAAIAEGAVFKAKRRGNVTIVAAHRIDVAGLEQYAASAPLPTSVSTTWPHDNGRRPKATAIAISD